MNIAEIQLVCRFCHSKKGCWTWQCYTCGEIDDVQQPPPLPVQKPVAWTTMPEADDWDFVSGNKDPTGKLEGKWFPLYTTPPAAQQADPLEYWNAVEGWVKIDEVREHFEAVNCGTIYKHGGEGRVPLYTEPPQRPWVGLTEDEIKGTWAQLWYDLTHGKLSTPDNEVRNNVVMFGQALEAKLKEKNNG